MDTLLHKDYLKKAEEKEKWIEYWAVLRNCVLYFYDEQKELWHDYCDKIEITPNAQCSSVRRKMYSYRFKLVTDEGTWLLKCQTHLQRQRWMRAIELAARELTPELAEVAPVIKTTTKPGCHNEQDLFGREIRHCDTARECNNNNNTLEELSLNFGLEMGDECAEKQNSRRNSKREKDVQKDKLTPVGFEPLQCQSVQNPDLWSSTENFALSDGDVEDGNSMVQSTDSAPVVSAKLIRVISSSQAK